MFPEVNMFFAWLVMNMIAGSAAEAPTVVKYKATSSMITTAAWTVLPFLPPTKKVSYVGFYDDATPFENVGFCMPFFGQSRALFVATNGFLAITPQPICPYFCHSSYEGFYKANPTQGTGKRVIAPGGDQALIGPYVQDLDPRQGSVAFSTQQRFGQDTLLVEWTNVTLFADTPAAQKLLSRATFQVECLANGTIFFRYASFIAPSEIAKEQSGPPFVGLIFSALQRVIVADGTTYGNYPSAIRFDPERDACGLVTTCGACTTDPTCVWCNALSFCVFKNVAADYCAVTGQFCETAYPADAYYTQSLAPIGGGVDPIITNDPSTIKIKQLRNTPYTPVSRDGFYFPFFYNPPAAYFSLNNSRVYQTLYISSNGFISMVPEDVHNCMTFCNPSQYSLVVAPLLMNFDTSNTSAVTYKFSAIPDNSLTVTWSNMFTPLERGLQNITFSATLWTTGQVSFRYYSSYNMASSSAPDRCWKSSFSLFPVPVSGLIQTYDKFPTSSIVSPYLFHENIEVTFQPLQGCMGDCSQKGKCNRVTRTCQCFSSNSSVFAGEDCGSCPLDRYSFDCLLCPKCVNSACDSGVTGTGKCNCTALTSGEFCEKTCAATSPQPLDCSLAGCNPEGSFCECGVCKCRPGWSGLTCHKWTDACKAQSLYGCDTCVSSKASTLLCGWCLNDKKCYTHPGQLHTPNTIPRCASYADPGATSKCPVLAPNGSSANPLNNIIVSVIFLLLGVCGCIVAALMWMFRRTRVLYPIAMYAAVGTTSLTPRNTIREVASVSRIAPQAGPVQGIPMAQVDLVKLRRLRVGRDENDDEEEMQEVEREE